MTAAAKKVDFAALVKKQLRAYEAGKAFYKKSDQLMDELIAAGAPIGEPIALGNGQVAIISDRFAKTIRVGYGGSVRRYEVDVERATDITRKL